METKPTESPDSLGSPSDTPETCRFIRESDPVPCWEWEGFARRLERERDDARRMWAIHQDRLAEACELIAEIMREEVNIADECEKFLRAYASQHLFPENLQAQAPHPKQP